MRLSKTFIFLSGFLFTAVLFLASCSSSDEKKDGQELVNLQLNFKPGDKYLYTTEVKQNIESFGMQMQQSMLMEMVYEVKGTEGENKKLDITYDRVVMKMGGTEYDSKVTSNNNADMGFIQNLIGKSFSLTLSPAGNITKVEGLENLIQSVAGTDQATRAEMEGQFSDTAVRLMMQNSFDLYPGKQVKKGESWTKKSQMSFSGINVNVENTYTLDSVIADKAYIRVVSVMNLPPTNMDSQGGVGAMNIEMNGNQNGTLEVGVQTGQILSGTTKQSIQGKVKVSGQEMPLSIQGDISISSKKI